MFTYWLLIFTMTYLLELPIYQLLWRRSERLAAGLLLCLLLNLATHPIVWFLLPRAIDNQVHYVLVAEGFAVIVEGILLMAIARWRGWQGWPPLALVGLAFVANAVSATVGELGGHRLLTLLGFLR